MAGRLHRARLAGQHEFGAVVASPRPSARHPSGPATGAHQVAIPSPESRDASTSGAAPCALSAAATTLVAASGPGAAWRPNA